FARDFDIAPAADRTDAELLHRAHGVDDTLETPVSAVIAGGRHDVETGPAVGFRALRVPARMPRESRWVIASALRKYALRLAEPDIALLQNPLHAGEDAPRIHLGWRRVA